MKTVVAILSIAWAILREWFRNLGECPYLFEPHGHQFLKCQACGKCFQNQESSP